MRQVLHKGVNRKHLVITPKFRMGVQNGQLRKKRKRKKKVKKSQKKKFLYFFIVTQRIKYKEDNERLWQQRTEYIKYSMPTQSLPDSKGTKKAEYLIIFEV